MNYILSILEANPTLYIGEIQQRLLEAQDCNVSIATICCAVRRLVLPIKRWHGRHWKEMSWYGQLGWQSIEMYLCIHASGLMN